MSDAKKYNVLENHLVELYGKFISLNDDEVKKNNEILKSILITFIDKMKEKDSLFKAMFTRIFYGGSYYDGLRVGKPEEFDLDLLLKVPVYAKPVLTTSNIPGFVHLQLMNFVGWMTQPEALPPYKNFGKLFEEKTYYLDTQKVLSWMEGLVQKTLNDFPQSGNARILCNNHGRFEIEVYKGGPALTLKISGPKGIKMMDVDLVTCFEFPKEMWPSNGFRSNPVTSKPNFFIVPKKPKTVNNQPGHRYWRLSFQEQERELIGGKNKLKPTVKLLKKLRDNLGHCGIASYYIKTVILHLAEKKKVEFWEQNSLSYVFMTVLKEYREDYIEKGKIPYYWNRNNNLIGGMNQKTIENINNRLKVVINDIEKNTNDPKVIAKYLLNSRELNTFMMGKLQLG